MKDDFQLEREESDLPRDSLSSQANHWAWVMFGLILLWLIFLALIQYAMADHLPPAIVRPPPVIVAPSPPVLIAPSESRCRTERVMHHDPILDTDEWTTTEICDDN